MKKRLATVLLSLVLLTGTVSADDVWTPGKQPASFGARITVLWHQLVNLF